MIYNKRLIFYVRIKNKEKFVVIEGFFGIFSFFFFRAFSKRGEVALGVGKDSSEIGGRFYRF